MSSKEQLNSKEQLKEGLFSHLQNLSFGRMAGTEGEQKAKEYILNVLKDLSVNTTTEGFIWSRWTVLRIFFCFLLLYTIFSDFVLIFPYIAWILLLTHVGLIITIIKLVIPHLMDSRFLGKKNHSENIISTIPCSNEGPNKQAFIITAHYDSVGTSMPQKIWTWILRSYLILALLFLIGGLILSIWSIFIILRASLINGYYSFFNMMILIIGIIVAILNSFIVIRNRNNKSLGVLDNATGVVMLFELVKIMEKNSLNDIDLIFIWTTCEEIGLCGSREYCKKNFTSLMEKYDLNNSWVLNIDMIGKEIGMQYSTGLIKKKKFNTKFNDIILNSAKDLDLKIKRNHMSISFTGDHFSFMKSARKHNKPLEIASLISKDGIKHIHSKRDTIDLCSETSLSHCVELIEHVIKKLDEKRMK